MGVHANSSVKGHCIWVHVLTELAQGPQLPVAVVPVATYGELHTGSSRVPICLCNMSICTMEIPAKVVVGQLAPGNQVPLVVHPTRTSEELTINPKQMDLGGPGPARSPRMLLLLLLKWEHMFAHSDLDLSKTALIKHKKELMDQMPFKEHY